LRGLVLIFLSVEFEIEQAGEITARAASRAASVVAEGDLNLAEGGFGLQEMLKRLLLVR
jgi:hypothetical protein